MSTAISGFKGKVLSGSTDMDVSGYSYEFDNGGFDSTTTADAGWEDTNNGSNKISGSFDYFFNPAKNPWGAVANLAPNSTTYPTLKLYCDDDKFATGLAKITKQSVKSATKEGITMTASFVSKGVWSLPT